MPTLTIVDNTYRYQLLNGVAHRYGNAVYVRLLQLYDAGFAEERGIVIMKKTTDNGVTWTTVGGSIGTAYDMFGNSYPEYYAGPGTIVDNIIYIPYYQQTLPGAVEPVGEVVVLRFDMDTDSWLSTSTGGPSVTNIAESFNLAFDSTGNGTIVYTEFDTTAVPGQPAERRCSVSYNTSETFGTMVPLTSQMIVVSRFYYNWPVYESDDTLHIYHSGATGASSADPARTYYLKEYGQSNIFEYLLVDAEQWLIEKPPVVFEISGVTQIGFPYLWYNGVDPNMPGIRYTPATTYSFTDVDYTELSGNTFYTAYSDGTRAYIITTDFNSGTADYELRRGVLTNGTWGTSTLFFTDPSDKGDVYTGNIVIGTYTGIVLDEDELIQWVTDAEFGYCEACPECPECPECPDSDLPDDADPPFPPVYPYLFSTNDIYGRDNLSLNLKMVRGDTYAFNASIILNGSAVDLTGGTVRMTAKWSVADIDGSAVFQLSSPATGIVITDAAAGEIAVTIASNLTSSLPAKKVELPYDIQFVNSLGKIYTVLYGTLTVVPDVTITA